MASHYTRVLGCDFSSSGWKERIVSESIGWKERIVSESIPVNRDTSLFVIQGNLCTKSCMPAKGK